jgi:hypothetical protein
LERLKYSNYPQRIPRIKIRTRTGERFTKNLPAGENAYIGEHANTAKRVKITTRNFTGEDLTKRLSWGSNKETKCYRYKGNKLKETCDLNTGYCVKEQQAQEE